jgi:hypothetical protein
METTAQTPDTTLALGIAAILSRSERRLTVVEITSSLNGATTAPVLQEMDRMKHTGRADVSHGDNKWELTPHGSSFYSDLRNQVG